MVQACSSVASFGCGGVWSVDLLELYPASAFLGNLGASVSDEAALGTDDPALDFYSGWFSRMVEGQKNMEAILHCTYGCFARDNAWRI